MSAPSSPFHYSTCSMAMSAQVLLHFPSRFRNLLLFTILFLGTLTTETDSVKLASCCCPEGYIRDDRRHGKGCHYLELIRWPSLKIFFIIIGTMIILTPALVNYWGYSNNSSNKKREIRDQYFDNNGGKLLQKKIKKRKRSSDSPQIRIYSAEEIRSATSNYSDSRKIMRESSKEGTVIYHGTTSNENNSNTTEVIIMKIEKVPPAKIKHFVKQLLFISQPHRNLVKLIGCCLETESPMLVYDLHGDGTRTLRDRKLDGAFSFQKRLKAAADSARALNHLHINKISGDKARVHGNVSSCNVVFDDSYNAKLFYAFDQYSCDLTENSGDQGTPINDESCDDVRGFGTVLKDLLARKMAFAEHPSIEQEVSRLADRCLSKTEKERPTMKEIEKDLSKLMMTMNADWLK